MDKSNSEIPNELPLDRLVACAMVELKKLCYSRRTVRRYRMVWQQLSAFSQRSNLEDRYSRDLALRFEEAYRLRDGESIKATDRWRRHIVFSVKVLDDFARTGRIERLRTEMQSLQVPAAMQKPLRDYEEYGRKRRHLRPPTLQDILPRDFSSVLPTIRVTRDATIPSVWDAELVVRLLKVVDRGSPRGKRDYAILLLACRLGMRLGDIRALTLNNLNWAAAIIDDYPSQDPCTALFTINRGAAYQCLCLSLWNSQNHSVRERDLSVPHVGRDTLWRRRVWATLVLLFNRDDKGHAFVERGIDKLPVSSFQRQWIKFLALFGFLHISGEG